MSGLSHKDAPHDMERVTDAMNAFCLDLGKLEDLASSLMGGAPCRIRKAVKWQRPTFWLFKVCFIDGQTWDVIVPHPYPFTSVPVDKASASTPFYCHAGKIYGNTPPPKIISWRASSDNDAGVAYFFIKSISGPLLLARELMVGYEDWDYMDWICYACSVRVSQLQREAKRNRMIRSPTRKLTSISPEHPVINTKDKDLSSTFSPNTSRRTTQETTRTSFPKSSNTAKTPKSVRFVTLGHDERFYDCVPPETMEERMSSFHKLKDGVRRRWKRLGRCLRSMRRKMERPVISALMRLGY